MLKSSKEAFCREPESQPDLREQVCGSSSCNLAYSRTAQESCLKTDTMTRKLKITLSRQRCRGILHAMHGLKGHISQQSLLKIDSKDPKNQGTCSANGPPPEAAQQKLNTTLRYSFCTLITWLLCVRPANSLSPSPFCHPCRQRILRVGLADATKAAWSVSCLRRDPNEAQADPIATPPTTISALCLKG